MQAGGLPPDVAKEMADRVSTAWQEAGRSGKPRFVALGYFGLGDTEERSRSYLLDCHGRMGENLATMIADAAL